MGLPESHYGTVKSHYGTEESHYGIEESHYGTPYIRRNRSLKGSLHGCTAATPEGS